MLETYLPMMVNERRKLSSSVGLNKEFPTAEENLMAIESIASVVQNLSDQLLGQTQNNTAQKRLLGVASPVTAAVAEDIFTPSSQSDSAQLSAADVGLFQLAPGTLTANQTGLATQEVSGTIPAQNSAQTTAANQVNTAGTPTQKAPDASTTQPTTSGAAAANVQLQIQSLNASLPALGLTNTEINQIDRIAALVQNFNPAAYANLVSQFEALAQNSGPSAVTSPAAAPSSNPASSSTTPASGSGYQVQEVSIKFTSSTQPGNSSFAGGGGKNSDGSNAPSNSAGLAVGKVQITLVDKTGQTVQVLST